MHKETCATYTEDIEDFDEEDHEECLVSDVVIIKDMLDILDREGVTVTSTRTVPKRGLRDGTFSP